MFGKSLRWMSSILNEEPAEAAWHVALGGPSAPSEMPRAVRGDGASGAVLSSDGSDVVHAAPWLVRARGFFALSVPPNRSATKSANQL